MSLPPIVVFDLDGTLAETAPDIMATLNTILTQEGCRRCRWSGRANWSVPARGP